MGRSQYSKLSDEEQDRLYREVYQLYIIENNSVQYVLSHVEGISFSIFRTIVNKYKLKKSREQIQKCREKTNVERYGASCSLNNESVKEKAKSTWINKYGTDNPFGSSEIQSRIKETNLQKYGNEFSSRNEDVKAKIRATNISRYGVSNPMQSDDVKSRLRESVRSRYGVEYVRQIDMDKDKLDLLSDRDRLKEYLESIPYESRTYAYMSNDLDVNCTTLGRYCERYGLSDIVNKSPTIHSSYEEDVKKLLLSYGLDLEPDRTIIRPYEIDLYSPEYRIGIEFNGTYWHSSEKKPANYHQMKSMMAKESNGTFIYHIWEYEWNDPRQHDIIISQIFNLFGINTKKIYARKCDIREVPSHEARSFLNKNHIQGHRSSRYRYGLYYNDELVSIMTFGKDRFIDKSDSWQLLRFCSKKGYSVVGGASRLFKHFIREIDPDKIVSYCDIAKGRGTTYEKLGFRLDRITPCNYRWISVDGSDVRTRYQCQKRFIKESDSDTRTEYDIMTSRGYYQIFDCGSYKFIWDRS